MKNKRTFPPALQIKAWELWKEICSVSGCEPGSPAITAKIQRREGTREDFLILFKFLSTMISGLFNKGVALRLPSEKKDFLTPELKKEYYRNFDELMREKISERADIPENTEIYVKAYKDEIWAAAKASDDPPAQVICGKIKWLMPGLAAKYLAAKFYVVSARDYFKYIAPNNMTQEEKSSMLRKCKNALSLVPVESLEQPVFADDQNSELNRFLAAPTEEHEEWEGPDSKVIAFYASLTLPLKLMLLGKWAGENATGEVMQRILGKSKSACGEINHTLKSQIKELPRFFPANLSWLKNKLIMEMQSEKSAQELLSLLEKQIAKEKENEQ